VRGDRYREIQSDAVILDKHSLFVRQQVHKIYLADFLETDSCLSSRVAKLRNIKEFRQYRYELTLIQGLNKERNKKNRGICVTLYSSTHRFLSEEYRG